MEKMEKWSLAGAREYILLTDVVSFIECERRKEELFDISRDMFLNNINVYFKEERNGDNYSISFEGSRFGDISFYLYEHRVVSVWVDDVKFM